jgi:quercetin dioxygenase-like cupin family protein
MQKQTFEQAVLADGFDQPVEVSREANGFMDVHSHPFEARALIVTGEIEIGWGDTKQTYRAGEIFHLTHAQPHWERYGPDGVTYWSARKKG